MINFNKQNLPFFKPNTGALFSKNIWSLKLFSLLALLMLGGDVVGQTTSISITTSSSVIDYVGSYAELQ